MKYFIDTEFIEGFHKPLFGKRRHFIDLISIGIVAEDGRTYYAISKEYDYDKASEWVKQNVITPIYRQRLPAFKQQFMDIKTFHKYCGKTNKQIAEEVIEFCSGVKHPTSQIYQMHEPEFYGYYSDYDWVLFCSLFGTMMQLPKGFPMYCIDLKQTVDEKTRAHLDRWGFPAHRFDDGLKKMKEHENYPKQENEHNALADAKWNFELYKFLQSI